MDLLNALVAFANFVFVPAVSCSAQLALGALGATLIYGILRFCNFAHGDTMTLGTTNNRLFFGEHRSTDTYAALLADPDVRSGFPGE